MVWNRLPRKCPLLQLIMIRLKLHLLVLLPLFIRNLHLLIKLLLCFNRLTVLSITFATVMKELRRDLLVILLNHQLLQLFKLSFEVFQDALIDFGKIRLD